jgi:predicted phage tail protein
VTPESDHPSGKEFGELRGEVRSIGRHLAEMQERSSRDQTALLTAIDGLRRDINTKASKGWVKEIDERTDVLKSLADEGSGAAKLARVAQGAIGAGIGILGYVLGQGGGLG